MSELGDAGEGSALIASESGQAVVELAVCMPVMLALVIICVDAMVYLGDCARFDRISAQQVAIAVTTPAKGSYSPDGAAAQARASIAEALGGGDRLTLSVAASQGAAPNPDEGFSIASLAPRLCTFTCTMTSTPWPFERGAFGANVFSVTHTRTYVVDPYRPGVVA